MSDCHICGREVGPVTISVPCECAKDLDEHNRIINELSVARALVAELESAAHAVLTAWGHTSGLANSPFHRLAVVSRYAEQNPDPKDRG